MIQPLRRINASLAGKLIISIAIFILLGGGVSWYLLISSAKKTLMRDAIEGAVSYSDLVKKSTRYSMLTFHREAIQHTLESIGSREDIKKIRIFDSKGRIFSSSQKNDIGHLVNRTSPACIGCHIDPEKPSIIVTSKDQWTIYKGKEGHRILTFVDPIYNEPSCSTAACHAHPQNQRVLGILETEFSLSSVDENIKQQTIEITIYGIVLISISSIILYFILRKLVMKPVLTLSHAMGKVADSDLTQTVALTSQDEMGLLAKTFNVMTKDLNIAKKKMETWTQTLEEEIAKKTDELRKSQDKLIQAEKLAALGRLTSDVAHEIRNPLTALGGFAHRLSKIVTGTKEKEYTEVMATEVDKLEKILKNVLTFSRDARLHLERHAIDDVVRDVVKLYNEACMEQSIDMKVEIGENLPHVLIDRDQVKQALSNLITNAIDAMPNGGTLTIAAGEENLYNVPFAFLKVSDTGEGIPHDKLRQIFEPFFTTKEIGHGTGLGLSISRKIIEEHGGFISAKSIMGEGSAFSLYFPYQSEEESLKVQCWEYMKCGRDSDASLKCPAYPNFGRICWAVAGTFCEGKVQGTFAQKYEDCKKCEFYQKNRNKEL
jgi:two-component system NtrC family sensor kinase